MVDSWISTKFGVCSLNCFWVTGVTDADTRRQTQTRPRYGESSATTCMANVSEKQVVESKLRQTKGSRWNKPVLLY